MSIDKYIALIDDYDTDVIKVIDEQGSLVESFASTQAKDKLAWDSTNDLLWLTKEDSSSTNDKIHKLDHRGLLSSTISITTANYDLEGICYDPSDNSLWTVNDNPGDQTLENRQVSDGAIIGSAIDISAIAPGCQDVCYDTSNDTLWITDNTGTGSKGRIYNFNKSGTILNTLIIDSSVDATITGTNMQGIDYDDRDDSLWFTMRHGYIYNIDKTATLQKKLSSPFSTVDPDAGPAGITLVPTWFRSVPDSPVYSIKMYDDAADTVVAAEFGTVAALAGGDNTDDISITGKQFKGFDFNGSDDYVDFGDVVLATTGYSISVWVYPDSLSSKIILGDAGNADWLRFNSGSSMTIKANGSTSVMAISGVNFNTSGWQHLVFVKIALTANDADIWRNGVKVASEVTVSNNAFTPEYVGQKNSGGYYEGKMSNLLLFDYILLDAEIAYLYNSGLGNESFLREELDTENLITKSRVSGARHEGIGRYSS